MKLKSDTSFQFFNLRRSNGLQEHVDEVACCQLVQHEFRPLDQLVTFRDVIVR